MPLTEYPCTYSPVRVGIAISASSAVAKSRVTAEPDKFEFGVVYLNVLLVFRTLNSCNKFTYANHDGIPVSRGICRTRHVLDYDMARFSQGDKNVFRLFPEYFTQLQLPQGRMQSSMPGRSRKTVSFGTVSDEGLEAYQPRSMPTLKNRLDLLG